MINSQNIRWVQHLDNYTQVLSPLKWKNSEIDHTSSLEYIKRIGKTFFPTIR